MTTPEFRERRLRIARIVSLVASTAISLAAGTNYVYSAYAPQLGERLHLSAKEINLIGTFGNLGMYLAGIPSGMLVDQKGPRPPILMGSVCMFVGYYPIHLAMLNGLGSASVISLCFFSMLTGIGSCLAFGGALKSAALNFPQARGTATSIVLAAFGLSAFFFSSLSSWLFPGNSEDFLLVLAVATSGMTFVSFFFCQVIPVPASASYVPVPSGEEGTRLHRSTKSRDEGSVDLKPAHGYDSFDVEPGTQSPRPDRSPAPTSVRNSNTFSNTASSAYYTPADPRSSDESSSLFSKSSDGSENARNAESLLRPAPFASASSPLADLSHAPGEDPDKTHALLDVRGWALLSCLDFWLLWLVIGMLTGVGLMTINNIGHDAQALWAGFDPSKSPEFVQSRQGMHVSIISVCSFAGRMLSGTSSDLLSTLYRLPRHTLLILSSLIFIIATLVALTISSPLHLWTVSALNGLAYGILFGVSPTIVSETFGIHALSTNWGFMTAAAVVFGNAMNMFYGKVYDDHSTLTGVGKQRECLEGRACFEQAYMVALVVAVAGGSVAAVGWRRIRVLMMEDGARPTAR